MLIIVFFVCFRMSSSDPSPSHSCVVSKNGDVSQCEARLLNGDWKAANEALPDIRRCLEQCRHGDASVSFQNCSLPAFPEAAFANLTHRRMRLEVRGGVVRLISSQLPGHSAFDSSSVFDHFLIEIRDSRTLGGWRWRLLGGVAAPTFAEVVAVRSRLVHVGAEIGGVAGGRLTAVRILKCQLRWLGKNAFASLQHVRTIELRDNRLEIIERSHLPTKAPSFKTLDLGNNRLTSLPENFFEGLPLQIVFLDGNGIKITMPLMHDILRRPGALSITGGVWPCDCGTAATLAVKLSLQHSDLECCGIDCEETIDVSNTCKNEM